MRKALFPFEITKRIYLFNILIIIVPVMLITAITQWQYYRHEMINKGQTLYAAARLLDKELGTDFRSILKEKNAENKPKKEQVLIINKVLQPEIEHLLAAFPGIGMGYYSKELGSRVAIGPNFDVGKLIQIPKDSPYLEVYKTGTPLLRRGSSALIWKGEPTLSLSYPIYRNGKLIGHIFATSKLTNLFANIFREIIIVFLIGLAVVLLTLTMSWNFFGKLKDELSNFAEAVLRGDSKEMDGLFPELNPIIDHLGKHTRELETVVKQLVSEIAKREEVEEELVEANEKITDILESAADAFFALDNDSNLTYINHAAERQMSVAREDIIGKPFIEVFPNAGLFVDCLAAAALEGQSGHDQIYAEKMGKWFEITSYHSKEGIGVYFRDITARKDDEEKIVFQANLLNQVRNAVITTDLEGKVTYWNNYAEVLYGWKSEEVIGKDISMVRVKPEYLGMSGQAVRASLAGKGYWEGELHIFTKDGVPTPVRRITTLIKNSEGVPTGIISVGIDQTESKKLEREMARLDQLHMVGEMAAGIGHEVRNPMTTVRGFIQLLAAKEDNGLRLEQFNLMIEELDRANSIITEYLSLAKNKLVELKPQSLNLLIKNMYPLLQADAIVSDKYIRTKLQKIPDLLLDEKEISQLVINLVRNGLEAMKPGGTVTVKTYMDAGFVVLEVADEGSGIDPQIIDRIGTPFVTTKESGTGLGLAVSYSIAGRHNAQIDVESTPEGTTFRVKFTDVVSVSTDVCCSNAV
ncbi:MAG TPA: PAS domain S-box protein [Desulfobacteria bacterium]|nr:PAS domain S-box protein [Desulfobacteria bacterium]